MDKNVFLNKQVRRSFVRFCFPFRVPASACKSRRSAVERQSAFRVWTLNFSKYPKTYAQLLNSNNVIAIIADFGFSDTFNL